MPSRDRFIRGNPNPMTMIDMRIESDVITSPECLIKILCFFGCDDELQLVESVRSHGRYRLVIRCFPPQLVSAWYGTLHLESDFG